MGKAKIVSEQGDGKYTIKIDYGTEERDARVEKLVARIAEIATEMEKANTKLQLAKAKMEASKAAVQQATSDYVAATQAVSAAFSAVSAAGAQLASVSSSPTATPAELASAKAMLASAEATYKAAQDDVKVKMDAQVEAAKALVDEKKKVAPLQIAVDLLKDEKAQLKKDKAYLSGLDLEETIPAWCADLTEDAEGEVATIEIPGENKSVLIKAGAESGGSVDGQLLARELQSPAQVFFNAAILPGWQKWQPTYRTGIITALDFEADTANVQLDDDKSSAQKLDINQTKTLEAVPVIYMGCHAGAFEVGDACVVRFDGMDWEKPQVVGFVDNPKSCPGGIGIVLCGLDGQLLPGHIGSDGKGVMYRLAPKTVKGTRTASGGWAARKMKKWEDGGKAVNADSTGRIYFTGVQGRDDSTYPVSFGEYGSVNEHAYAVEDRLALPVYRHGKNVGSSRDDRAPLPFVLEWTDGEKYAAQLVPRYPEGGSTTATIELLIGPLKTRPGQMVGAIVATVDIPPNTIIPWWKISIHPNGRKARALSFKDGNVCKLDFDITPTSLIYTTSGCKSNDRKTVKNYDAPLPLGVDETIYTGDGANGTLTIKGGYDINNNILTNLWVDDVWSEVSRPLFGTTGTGTIKETFSPSYVYAFGPKGEEIDIEINGREILTSSASIEKYSYTRISTWGPGGDTDVKTSSESSSYSYTVTEKNGGSEILEIFGDDAGSMVVEQREGYFAREKTVFTPEYEVSEVEQSGGGTSTSMTRGPSGVASIFLDRYIGFAIGRVYTGETLINNRVINVDRQGTTAGTTEIPASAKLVVKHRAAGVIMELPLTADDSGQFVAYSAADPLTGSIVVNLQRRSHASSGEDPTRLASWIFIVDETGVKTIHDLIPDLPQNVCAQENRLLITV